MHVIERYRLIGVDEARIAQERHEQTSGRTGGKEGNWPFDPGEKKGPANPGHGRRSKYLHHAMVWESCYRRTLLPWEERICAENNTDVLHQGFEHVPTAAKPDF